MILYWRKVIFYVENPCKSPKKSHILRGKKAFSAIKKLYFEWENALKIQKIAVRKAKNSSCRNEWRRPGIHGKKSYFTWENLEFLRLKKGNNPVKSLSFLNFPSHFIDFFRLSFCPGKNSGQNSAKLWWKWHKNKPHRGKNCHILRGKIQHKVINCVENVIF